MKKGLPSFSLYSTRSSSPMYTYASICGATSVLFSLLRAYVHYRLLLREDKDFYNFYTLRLYNIIMIIILIYKLYAHHIHTCESCI